MLREVKGFFHAPPPPIVRTHRKSGRAELTKRYGKAETLLGLGKVADALGLLETFPNELKVGDVESALKTATEALHQSIRRLYADIDTRAKTLVEQGKLQEARDLYSNVVSWKRTEFPTQAGQAITNIDSLVAKQKRAAIREANEAFQKLVNEVMGQLAARKYDDAESTLADAKASPTFTPVRDKVHELLEIVRGAEDFLASAGIGASKLKPGQPVSLGGVSGQFVRFSENKIWLRSGVVDFARSLRELKPRELLELAVSGHGGNTELITTSVALFLLADGDPEAARRGLEAARAKGQDVKAVLGLIERYGGQGQPSERAKQ